MAIGKPVIGQTFLRLHSNDQAVNRLQDNMQLFAEFLQSVPILDGVLLEGISLAVSSSNLVQHGLDRTWRGWFIVNLESASFPDIFVPSTDTSDRTRYIQLDSSVAATVSLWVF